ncbi:Transcriptional regulator WAR1 [Fusarium oxysporum f. sp. albedinis]|nr:Transcriptional regulator WAR1 [Fusarium oxysporum f. sp. albedinis]
MDSVISTNWYESDEWRKRFGNKVMIIPLDENKAYLEVLHATGLEIDEIPGADFTLPNVVPDDAGSSRLQDTQEPKAWVSDRNLIHPRNGQSR